MVTARLAWTPYRKGLAAAYFFVLVVWPAFLYLWPEAAKACQGNVTIVEGKSYSGCVLPAHVRKEKK